MVPTFFHLRVDIQVPAVLPMRANPSAYQDGHTELYQVNVAALHQHRRLSTSLSVLTNSVGQAASAQDTGLNVLVKRLVRAETGIRLSVRIACRLALIVPKTRLLPQHQHKTLSPGYISVARAPTQERTHRTSRRPRNIHRRAGSREHRKGKNLEAHIESKISGVRRARRENSIQRTSSPPSHHCLYIPFLPHHFSPSP